MGNPICNSDQDIGRTDESKACAESKQKDGLRNSIYILQDMGTVFKAGVYKPVKDVDRHGPTAQVREKCAFLRYDKGDQESQSKSCTIADQAYQHSFQRSLSQVMIIVSSVAYLRIIAFVDRISDKENGGKDQSCS